MTNDDFERLAWERVDGTISAEDGERLDRMLAGDEAARTRFGSIESMSEKLADLRTAEPPAELRPRINRALAASSPRWRRRAAPARVWRVRLAYLAAGVMLGLVAARLLVPDVEVDRRDVVGAMTPPQAAVTLDLDGAGVLAIWPAGESRIGVELTISTETDVELLLGAEPATLTIIQAGLASVRAGEAGFDGRQVRLTAQGPGHCTVTLGADRTVTALSVAVSAGGRAVVAARTVPLTGGGGG